MNTNETHFDEWRKTIEPWLRATNAQANYLRGDHAYNIELILSDGEAHRFKGTREATKAIVGLGQALTRIGFRNGFGVPDPNYELLRGEGQ